MPKPATELIIVGAGAGGLMAAAVAGDLGLRAVLVEHKHQGGRKLLMCANSRCNLTNDLSAAELLAAYGRPVAPFLTQAIKSLTPGQLRTWFKKRGLQTRVHKDGKVFPKSEKAADVLRFFSNRLRIGKVPTVYNASVEDVIPEREGLRIVTANFSLTACNVLIATGGVSYPKTGSVGDGQKIAKRLGHRLVPYRPGLVGFEIAEDWLTKCGKGAFSGTTVDILADGTSVGTSSGEIEYSHQGIRGPAIVDASRLIARAATKDIAFVIDLCPRFTEADVAEHIGKKLRQAKGDLPKALSGWLMEPRAAQKFVQTLPASAVSDTGSVARHLKHWTLHATKPRPLKEAMVTVGGVSLDEVTSSSMESKKMPGLYFCGEVLDIDGPTGGFNLHAAFATAQLAVQSVAAATGR